MAHIAPSRRVRRTPFSDGVTEAGVSSYTVYNRMLLPAAFENMQSDYRHLKTEVQVWDVACERQVALSGPDAYALAQRMTPRDLSKLTPNKCFYIPVVDQNGGMLNDPVILNPSENTYWISIADSDLLLWVKGLAAALNLNVRVWEPDVSPLAIQGPKSDELAARVFGDNVRNLKFFGCDRFEWRGQSLLIARSGYSKQGGFEIYLEDGSLGMDLWNDLMQAGADLNVRAGCPNGIERIEAGLLSYGNDMTDENSPLECGLGKYVQDHMLDHCIGGDALRAQREQGVQRQIRPVAISGDLPPCDRAWPLFAGDQQVGQVTSCAASPDFNTNASIAMVDRHHWNAGTQLSVETQAGRFDTRVMEKFWI